MKKIYCKKCGNKILDSDADYCPRCGARINDYAEVQQMQKSKKTRNIILIALIIICIAIAGIFTYAMFFNEQYQVVKISETASLEMPVGKGLNGYYVNETSIYQVNNGKGVMVMSYNSNNKDIVSAFAFAAVKEMAVGSRFNEDSLYQTTVNGSTVWSIATGNDTTHDNIIISSHDKDLTLKIYESIKYNSSNIKENTSDDTSSGTSTHVNNTNGKTIYGYWDTGEPIYDKETWENYQKYGKSDWPGYETTYDYSYDYYDYSNVPSSTGGGSQEAAAPT